MAPGVGIDVDDVAVLSEPIDEGAQAGRVVKDGAHCLNARLVVMTMARASCRRLMM